MAICAIIRIAGFHYKGVEDDTWEFFWQQIEGAVAIMMASITAFRTLFVKQTNQAETAPRSPAGSFFHRIYRRFQTLARAQPDEKPTLSNDNRALLQLPVLPSPIFTGVRTFIRKNNVNQVDETTFTALESVVDGSEADYHAAVWAHTPPSGSSAKASSRGHSSRSS